MNYLKSCIIYSFLLFTSATICLAQNPDGPAGTLSGIIVEQSTGNSIAGAHIVVLETENATASTHNGSFQLSGLNAGIYTIQISYIGFRQRTITDVVIRGNRTTRLIVEMRDEIIAGDEITVTAGYFHRSDTESVSRRSLNAEEIRRSPGGGQELARVISTTPGVATTGDTSQDLMVRGGSPRENGFYIDNIFLPGIQHFEELNGSSNGPIGLVNTDLVEHLDFYAGGFSASYGNRMSSMANIRYREASRERRQANIEMSMAGFGGSLETPLNDGKGSWLVSIRRSYLDLIAEAINAGGAPRYGDVQAKGVYDINRDHKLTFLQIYGDSRFTNEIENALENGFLTVPDFRNRQNTTGLNWRRTGSERSYSNSSISWSYTGQQLKSIYTVDGSLDLRYNNRHDFFNLRHVNYHRTGNRFRFETGGDLTYTRGRFDYKFEPFINEAGIQRPGFVRNLSKEQFAGELFGTMIIRPEENITINTGFRAGYNHLNNQFTLAPRASVSWELTHRATVNVAAGIYRQDLPLYIRSQQISFDKLKDPRVLHLITGIEYLLGNATMFSIEVYDKQYRNLPLQPPGYSEGLPVYVFDSYIFFDELTDAGRAYARGIDLMLHRKIKDGLYGTLSASMFKSRYLDFNGKWQNRDFDVKYLLSAIGGFRPNQKWEFSARWTYIGSRPYTPFDIVQSSAAGRAILDGHRFNSERLPAFHSLYARFDRRIFLDRVTITTFFEMWNAYNRSNVETMYWNQKTGTPDTYHQFSLLPVGGFTIEF